LYRPYVDVLTNLFYLQWCVGCDRRVSDVLCPGASRLCLSWESLLRQVRGADGLRGSRVRRVPK
jgi:hypothetical protein